MSELIDPDLIEPTQPNSLKFSSSTAEAVPDIPKDTRSEGLKLLTHALVQIETTIKKAEEAQNSVQNQLQTIQTQRIGLNAQKYMIFELKKKLEEIEGQNQ